MANKSAIVAMRKAVSAYFEERNVSAVVALGWRGRAQTSGQGPGGANRVVFVVDEDAGKLAAPHGPGPRFDPGDREDEDVSARPQAARRALANWEEAITVSVWACDPSAPKDEEAQIEATETLFEWVIRAVSDFQTASAVWGSVKRTVATRELTFGLEIRASLTLKHPMFDEEDGVAYPAPVVQRGAAA